MSEDLAQYPGAATEPYTTPQDILPGVASELAVDPVSPSEEFEPTITSGLAHKLEADNPEAAEAEKVNSERWQKLVEIASMLDKVTTETDKEIPLGDNLKVKIFRVPNERGEQKIEGYELTYTDRVGEGEDSKPRSTTIELTPYSGHIVFKVFASNSPDAALTYQLDMKVRDPNTINFKPNDMATIRRATARPVAESNISVLLDKEDTDKIFEILTTKIVEQLQAKMPDPAELAKMFM